MQNTTAAYLAGTLVLVIACFAIFWFAIQAPKVDYRECGSGSRADCVP